MFTFIANLKPYTYSEDDLEAAFSAYLLSVDYAGPHRRLARQVVAGGRTLCADNGNFARVTHVARQFQVEAEALNGERNAAELKRKKRYRPNEIPDALRDRYRDLAGRVRVAAEAALPQETIVATLQEQEALDPSYSIGPEDLTIPVLILLGIEPEYLNEPLSWYAHSSARAAALNVDARKTCTRPVWAGMHALDYDTAREAGRHAARGGASGIAVGLGAVMGDNSLTDFRVVDGQVVELGRKVARSYLRTIEVAAGLLRGFADVAGKRPPLHVLGIGTPILLPLLALLGNRKTFLATDSTAPLQDGMVSLTIAVYVDTPAPLKLKTHVIAERWMAEDLGWSCPCPPCRDFAARYPFRIDEARAWWIAAGRPKLTPAHMRGPLAEFLPWLGASADIIIRVAAGLARVAHNHWIIRRIEQRTQQKQKRSLNALRDWTADLVEAYANRAKDDAWKAAVREAWRIADATTTELAAMERKRTRIAASPTPPAAALRAMRPVTPTPITTEGVRMETTAPPVRAPLPPTFHRIFRSRWHRFQPLARSAAKRFYEMAKKLVAEDWTAARRESRDLIRIGEAAVEEIARQFADPTQGRSQAGAVTQAEAAICVALIGYRAGAIVALSAKPRRAPYVLTGRELAQVETWIDEQAATLARSHAGIHAALVQGDPSGIAIAASAAREAAATILPAAVDAERALYTEVRHGRARAGETLLAASMLRRRAIWTIGLGLLSRRWSLEPKRLRVESLAAQKRAFAANLPSAPDRTFTSMETATAPGPYELRGWVRSIEFVREPEQLSILTLAASRSDTAPTVALHTKRVRLTNLGICRQAYVRVGVAIDPDNRKYWLDQFPLAQLAATSWSSYALAAMRPFYDLYPHSFDLQFTGTPEAKTALGIASIRRGSRELTTQPPSWLMQRDQGAR